MIHRILPKMLHPPALSQSTRFSYALCGNWGTFSLQMKLFFEHFNLHFPVSSRIIRTNSPIFLLFSYYDTYYSTNLKILQLVPSSAPPGETLN